jgi:hypothetical protein
MWRCIIRLCIPSVILYNSLNLAVCNGHNMSQWDREQNTELLFRLCNLLSAGFFVPGVSVHETKCLSEVISYSQVLHCIGGAHLLVGES